MQLIVEGLYVSAFGMSVVFAGLVSMIVLVNLQTWFVGKMQNRKKTAVPVPADAGAHLPAPQPTAPVQPVKAYPQNLQLVQVEEKTAALIMAIVCHETGSQPDELYFKSIRLLEE
jgi:Na+-transporting methylmalonyl-CoA/oxaloacetate decarboxylase gamma subunit